MTIVQKFFAFTLILMFSASGFSLSETSEEKYEIYSTAIDGIYSKRPNNTSVLIKNYTVNDFEKLAVNGNYRKQLSAFLPSLSAEAIDSYLKESEKESELNSDFDLKITYTLIKKSDIEKLFKNGTASGGMTEWDDFRKKFPDVRNITGLSQIGFNSEKSQSLVYMEEWCGDLCGMGYYILLEKENGKWKFISWYSPWVS